MEVDKILDVSYNAEGIKIYLIKWAGHDIHQATWEPQHNLNTLAPDDLNRFLRNMNDRRKYAIARGGNVRAKKTTATLEIMPHQIVHRRKRWHLVYKSRLADISQQILERVKAQYNFMSQFIAVSLPTKREVHVYMEFTFRESIRLEFFGIGKKNGNKKANIPTLMTNIKSNQLICEIANNVTCKSVLADPPTIDVGLLWKNRRSHRSQETLKKAAEKQEMFQQKADREIIKIEKDEDEDVKIAIGVVNYDEEESENRKTRIDTLFKLIEPLAKKKKVCK